MVWSASCVVCVRLKRTIPYVISVTRHVVLHLCVRRGGQTSARNGSGNKSNASHIRHQCIRHKTDADANRNIRFVCASTSLHLDVNTPSSPPPLFPSVIHRIMCLLLPNARDMFVGASGDCVCSTPHSTPFPETVSLIYIWFTMS